jgi:hypothetical protein
MVIFCDPVFMTENTWAELDELMLNDPKLREDGLSLTDECA